MGKGPRGAPLGEGGPGGGAGLEELQQLGASVSEKEEHGLPPPYHTALFRLFFQVPLSPYSLCVF